MTVGELVRDTGEHRILPATPYIQRRGSVELESIINPLEEFDEREMYLVWVIDQGYAEQVRARRRSAGEAS